MTDDKKKKRKKKKKSYYIVYSFTWQSDFIGVFEAAEYTSKEE